MRKESLLYAIPSWHCNLSCPHCYVNEKDDNYNRDKFMESLNKFNGEVVIFGGEPTVHLDRLYDIINLNKDKIKSVSTNLMILNDELISIYKSLHGIATSWNPHRFTNDSQYNTWMNHCKIISDNDIKYTLMITLTDDLFEIPILEFINKLKTWITPSLKTIKFEHYVGTESTADYFERTDNWLCILYQHWDLEIPLQIADKVNNWKHDCSNIYTLEPTGVIRPGCPHKQLVSIPNECFNCERFEICQPCRLQRYCSYPKKFAKLVKENNNE